MIEYITTPEQVSLPLSGIGDMVTNMETDPYRYPRLEEQGGRTYPGPQRKPRHSEMFEPLEKRGR
jgi:hypothetical protein